MKIQNPVLVPDVSNWCDHINAKELEDGGCQSVVVGLYPTMQGGKQVLHPTCRKQCVEVASKSKMVLQAYFWDDIILSSEAQIGWLLDTLKLEGLPIKWVWLDQEQWHTNWSSWYLAREGTITWDLVPHASPVNISAHNQYSAELLGDKFPKMGIYTNKGFVSSWAAPMDAWLPEYPAWVAQYGRQPKEVTSMSWEQLKAQWLPNYDMVLSAGQPPIQVKGHQFTGDACILPGAYDQYGKRQALDVSVFSQAFIDQIRGVLPAPVPPAPLPEPKPAHPDICPTCLQAWPQSGPVGYIEYIEIYPRVNVRMSPNGSWCRFAVKDEIEHVKLPVTRQDGYIQLTDGWIWEGYVQPKA